ncbi:GNAT family N-acetyltransferase [Thalassotalea sp. G2M2-11]|uniref:GNAT family N-acetyltransferase n=1 Tax=Thalassotalea sp. G2M2-11 TaxID=2787627 RepID=UPI0019CFE059|nr:GNAT family N-acetyltransferase [Thalassotalea sp. G2M2-11]
MNKNIIYRPLAPQDYQAVIALGNFVHGEGYMDTVKVKQWVEQGIKDQVNASYVAYDKDKLVGFRITFAAKQWHIDKWCSPVKWQVAPAHVCYFKCNTVDENYRGHGIGSKLLKLAINAVKKQGAQAGVSHLWMQSPGNSAVKYFSKCGGTLVTQHPRRWNELEDYICTLCGKDCHCSAAEMIILFDKKFV